MMGTMARRVLAMLLTMTTVGCAAIMHGTSQKIDVASSPANATVYLDKQPMGKTPLSINVKRSDTHVVTIEMRGYEPATIEFDKKVSAWVWGDVFLTGLIGFAVDAFTGALYNLTPEQISTELKKNGGRVSINPDAIVVLAVLHPDPQWQKVGNLIPATH